MISPATMNLKPAVVELDVGPVPKCPLWVDSVEKVENAATAKFAQKRSDRRLRLAMPSHSTWEGR
jgi:hypothetical protein